MTDMLTFAFLDHTICLTPLKFCQTEPIDTMHYPPRSASQIPAEIHIRHLAQGLLPKAATPCLVSLLP